MNTLNFKSITCVGDDISSFAKQLIALLKAISGVKKSKLKRIGVITLIAKTAESTNADISEWRNGVTDKMILAIQGGAIKYVTGDFNGLTIRVSANSTVKSIVTYYQNEWDRSAKRYEKTPQAKALKLEMEQRKVNLQALADALMQKLPTLDFKDNVAILEWLSAIAGPVDHFGTNIPKAEIISTFNKNGFFAGVNTGEDFKEDDEDNYARYIIGQGLSCLESIGPIHMVGIFTERWKKKFNKELSVN